jgi:putative RNA 2'-phosphotransferase
MGSQEVLLDWRAAVSAERHEAISKLLSYALRHRPDEFGLAPDQGGWVEVDALIPAVSARGHSFDRAILDQLVADSGKKRFTVSPDGRRIRAAQGHSIPIDLGLVRVDPPEILYHGTADRFLAAILAEGLRPMGRHHVHLSIDEENARIVGSRHGRPVVLRIYAGELHRDGHPFFQAENGVWLTPFVPSDRRWGTGLFGEKSPVVPT